MAEELISKYVDREKFGEDTKFIQDQLKLVYSAYDQLSKVKVDLTTSVKSGDVAKNAEAGLKATIKLKEETKAYVQTLSQRFASEAKLETIQTNYAKQTAVNRVETQKLTAEMKANAQAELAVVGSRERAIAQIKVLTQQKDKLNLINKEEKKQYDDIVVKIERYNKFLKETGTTAEKQKQNIGNYSGAVVILQKSLADVNTKMEVMLREGKQQTDVYKQLEKEAGLLNQLVNSQSAGFANAAVEIRANTKALIDLENAGLKGSKTYQELALKTGELKDQLADVKAATKNLGSDTFVFDGLIGAAQGLAGAYGAVQGAAALFGDENEELQKTFVKLQAVMTILQSLQAVQNALQKENSAMLLVQDLRTKALIFSQSVYTAVVGASTGALKAFRIALLLSGIGVIIGLILVAANAMGVFGGETEKTTEEINAQTEALEKHKKALGDISDEQEKQRNRNKGNLNELKRELEIAEARGVSEQKLQAIRNQIFEREQFNLKVRQETFRGNATEEADIEEQLKDLKNKNIAENLAAQKNANDKAQKDREKNIEKQKDIAKREAAATFQIIKESAEEKARLLLNDAENEKLSVLDRLEALRLYKEQREVILLAQKRFDLQNKELTPAEKLAIENKYSIDSNLILEDYFGKREQLYKDNAAAIKEHVAEMRKNLDESFNKTDSQESLDAEKQRFEELKKLDLDFTEGRITNIEDYNKSKEDINKRYDKQDLERQIQHYTDLLQIQAIFGEDTIETERKILELKKALYDKDAANFNDAEAKKKQAKQEVATKREEAIRAGAVVLQNIVLGQYDKEKNKIQELIQQIDIKKEKEIEAVNLSLLSEQEKVNAISLINVKAQSQKDELARRQKKLDYDAAVFNRGIAIAEIIANTAIATTKALSNPSLVPWVIALGAFQLAATLARPIPKFKEGLYTDYEGLAIVGDGGKAEVHERADGSFSFTPKTDTLTHVGKGDRIHPDADQWVNSIIAAAFRDSKINEYAPGATKVDNGIEKKLTILTNTIRNKKELHVRAGFNSVMSIHKYGDWWVNYINEQTDF